MTGKPEFRAAELRAGEGRQLVGLALPWRTETVHRGQRERFEPASAQPSGDAILNAFHDSRRPLAREPGSLRLEGRADGLHMLAELPETREADDCLALVRGGVLKGLSVEFHAEAERREAGCRVIDRARVVGLAVVPRAAYSTTTVEARGAMLANALALAASGPDVERAAAAAGITVEQLRRALEAFGAAFPEPPGHAPVWML